MKLPAAAAALWSVFLTISLTGQTTPPNPLLSGADAAKLAKRIVELMESTGAALPELQLASAPLVAGARNTLTQLQKEPNNAAITDHFLRQTRAFLAISDNTPKLFPFSETAHNQLVELRDSYERLDTHLAALIQQKEAESRSPDPNDVQRYGEENSRVLPPGANPRVVFLGDSITDFWHLNEYFTGRDFLNRGISGQVTSQMLGRFQTDVIDLRPRAVLILGGTNDIARGTPPDFIENNFRMMADLARAHQIKVLIASVLPVGPQQTNRPMQTIRQLNTWIEQFCTQTGATYVDYFSKMRDGSGFIQSDLSDDGLHPNSKGYRIMAPIAIAAIDHAIGTSNAPAETPRKRRIHVF